MYSKYQVCSSCVMDTTDPDITFNKFGVCRYCQEYENKYSYLKNITQEETDEYLANLAMEIQRNTKQDEYNCLLGVSGGVDSSYVAYLIHKMGLNPLVVHFDNGWNSELAVKNIEKIITKLRFDLHTFVINWEEFKDLQRAFFKASVIDIEVLTDHAIAASMFNIAKKYKIKYVFSGCNIQTEYEVPMAWRWSKSDWKNIVAIHRKFGERALKTFPKFGFYNCLKDYIFKPYKTICPLNYIWYQKKYALQILAKEFDWKYYGGKHYESIFTKFYQAYILPKKFGIDKRRAHLSSLIRNDEISRQDALVELQKPLYHSAEFKTDLEYVLKKLDFTQDEFSAIMQQKPLPHDYYSSDKKTREMVIKIGHWVLKRFPCLS